MKINNRLTDKEYEELGLEYEQNPPKLSGKPGLLTSIHERTLITELLPPDYVRIVNMRAKALSISPSEVIQNAIKSQLVENA